MEIKQLLKEIKSTGIKDQELADKLSVDGDSINQCIIYKWRSGSPENERLVKRYNRIKDLHRKLRRKIKND